MDIHEWQEAGRTRLTLTGELDLATAPALHHRLRQSRAQHRNVRLDLSNLDFIDCAGMHVLIQAFNDAQGDGVRLEVEGNLAPQVKCMAKLTHQDRFT